MNKFRLSRFSVLRTSLIVSALYFVLFLCFIPLFFIVPIILGQKPVIKLDFYFFLGMPLLYAVFGFVFTVIGCLAYNLLANWLGGIEIEFKNVK